MRKTAKSQKTLKCTVCDGVTAFKVTASRATQVKILEITHDDPVGFLPRFVTVSEKVIRSEESRRDDVKEAITEP